MLVVAVVYWGVGVGAQWADHCPACKMVEETNYYSDATLGIQKNMNAYSILDK